MKKYLIVFLLIVLFLPFTATAEAAREQIIINKGTNQLAYYQDNKLIKVFPIATGKNINLTPEGNFYITSKIVNPPYYKKNIPGGSPYNPLGPRWLGLSIPGGAYGIHGTNNPASIGTYASEGCIRLYNQDIIWLFERVSIGTPVKIIRSNTDLVNLSAPEDLVLTVNGKSVLNNCPTMIINNDLWVALRPVAQSLAYTVYWDNAAQSIIIKNSEHIVILKIGSQELSLNGKAIVLSKAPRTWNNNVYVPIDFFNQVFGMTVSWHEKDKRLDLFNPQQYLPLQ